MNTACKNFKDIRFKYEDGVKVYRRAVIDKKSLATNDDYIYIRQTTLPMANKIIAIIDLEVLSQSVWKKVKAGYFDDLAKVFNEEDKDLDVMIDIHVIADNENGNLTTVVPPVNPIAEEIVDTARTEVHIDETINDNTEDSIDEADIEDTDDEEISINNNTENHQNRNNSFKKKKRH